MLLYLTMVQGHHDQGKTCGRAGEMCGLEKDLKLASAIFR